MGFMKKKEKEIEAPVPPHMEMELVMHNTTTVTADENADGCVALFQTDKMLTPHEWQELAERARKGWRFSLVVCRCAEGVEHAPLQK